MLFTPCDREATLSPTATPPGLHGAHLWVFIEVMWAMSPVSLYFPNPGQSGPGLGSITFSFSGMFIPGLPLLEYQIRQNSLASLADAKGAQWSRGGDWLRSHRPQQDEAGLARDSRSGDAAGAGRFKSCRLPRRSCVTQPSHLCLCGSFSPPPEQRHTYLGAM